MKRTFLKVALLSSLMLSMPLAFTSCKDYDDDINNLQNRVNDLKTEMESLKVALQKAQADADAAKQAAAAAADEAAKLKAYADQAAAEAKADAIKQAMDAIAALEAKTATKDDLAVLKAQVEAIETGLSTLGVEMDAVKNTLAQLQIQLDAVEKYKALIDQNSADIAKCNSAITELQELIQSLQAKVDSMTTADNLEAAKQELKKYCDDAIAQANATVAAINKNLVTLLTTQLRSLVFLPNMYVDGIESVVYDYVTFMAKTASAGSCTEVNQDGVSCTAKSPGTDWNYANSQKKVEIDPINYVDYAMNPSSAVVKGEDLTFIGNDAQKIETRAASAVPVVVADDVTTNNGNLTVGYTVVGSKILTSVHDQNQKISIFALQAKVPNMTVGDETTTVGTITSDFAMLTPAEYTPLALAFKSTGYPAEDCPTTALPDDLWSTLALCIKNVPSIEVAWDGTLDLNNYVATHYSAVGSSVHQVWSAADLAKYGFTYDFFPIQYTVGSNLTSDTQFINQDLSNGIVDPCGVTVDGVADNQDTKASVGKNPIVRVRLLDANKNVALVGFIKINIVEEAPVAEDDIVIDPGVNMGDISFGCTAWNNSVDWAYITNKIYQLVNMSKDEFESTYTLQTTSADTNFLDVNQYTKSGNNFSLLNDKYGTIGLVPNETGATTNVIKWIITTRDQQRIYEQNNETVTVYVCYATNNPLKAKIYVPLTINKVTKPEGTIEKKAVSAWYRNDEVNLFNVPQPSFNNLPTPFTYNLNNAWFTGTTVQTPGPSVTGNGTAAYNKFVYYLTAANNTTVANVKGEDGTTATYTLSVSANKNAALLSGSAHNVAAANMAKHALLYEATGNYEYNNNVLYAAKGNNAKVAIATLDQTTGALTYENNEVSRALLNHYASTSAEGDDSRDRTNAQLGVSIGLCYYSSCNIALKLTNGIYNGYWLRPINVVTNGEAVFQDAHANGSTIYLYDMLKFTDWRYFAFEGANRWLFAYYGVKGVEVDVDKIQSNYAGTWGQNSTVSNNFVFKPGSANGSITYPSNYDNSDASNANIEQIVRDAMGTLTWNNNGADVKTFQCEIPVKVSYYWGVIYTNINATVIITYNKK